MSRCFPFPPPGYEKKTRIDEADPLIKEKYRERKHKKDKEREKKEGKEKKSKDRSKDKHKERKEKHKDGKDKEKDKEKSKPLEEKKAEVPTNLGDREKLVANTLQKNSNGESKYVQELARRIRYEEEATRSQSAQKINHPIQETNHREDDDDKRINTQKSFAEAKSSENAVTRGSFGADRAEVMGKPMENRFQARQMDKEGVKKNEAKDKEKREGKTEPINRTRLEKPKVIGGSKLEERAKDALDIRNCKPPDLSRASVVKNLIAEGNLGKRKDLETNGFLYENGTKPKTFQKYSASVSSMENGRTLVSQRTPSKPEFKEVKINGFVISGEKQVKENGEASAKLPHPDLKYLNQILNLPKRKLLVEVNSDDEEEWLFGQLGVKLKKARRESPGSGESLQVWNQAFRIESADIAALPYVVPF